MRSLASGRVCAHLGNLCVTPTTLSGTHVASAGDVRGEAQGAPSSAASCTGGPQLEHPQLGPLSCLIVATMPHSQSGVVLPLCRSLLWGNRLGMRSRGAVRAASRSSKPMLRRAAQLGRHSAGPLDLSASMGRMLAPGDNDKRNGHASQLAFCRLYRPALSVDTWGDRWPRVPAILFGNGCLSEHQISPAGLPNILKLRKSPFRRYIAS